MSRKVLFFIMFLVAFAVGACSGSPSPAGERLGRQGEAILSTSSSMSTARLDAAATLLPDGRVMVVGGQNMSGNLSSTEIYNPATDTWTAGPDMSVARVSASIVTLKDGRVLVIGDSYGISGSLEAELYDGTSWTACAPVTMPKLTWIRAGVLSDGTVIVMGAQGPCRKGVG